VEVVRAVAAVGAARRRTKTSEASEAASDDTAIAREDTAIARCERNLGMAGTLDGGRATGRA
jgi:hypothetical protein